MQAPPFPIAHEVILTCAASGVIIIIILILVLHLIEAVEIVIVSYWTQPSANLASLQVKFNIHNRFPCEVGRFFLRVVDGFEAS